MTAVHLVPAGADSAPGVQPGDYLLRPCGDDLYEVGKQDDGCTWIGTVAASLLPLPAGGAEPGDGSALDQTALLTAVEGVAAAEHLRGG